MKKILETLETHSQVYKPIDDSFFLAEQIGNCAGLKVLDIGCGNGILSIAACIKNAKSVTSVDINPHAIKLTRRNAKKQGFEYKITAKEGNLLLSLKESFDTILCNPPYLPTPKEMQRKTLLSRAWNSGFYGTEFVTNLFKKINGHLKPDGLFMFVQSSINNIGQTIKCLKESHFKLEQSIEKSGIAFGPLNMERLDHLKLLKRAGLSKFVQNAGTYYETLHVIKARK